MAGLVLGHGKTQNTKQHVTEKNNILTAVKKSGSRNAKKEEKKEKKKRKKKKKKKKKVTGKMQYQNIYNRTSVGYANTAYTS